MELLGCWKCSFLDLEAECVWCLERLHQAVVCILFCICIISQGFLLLAVGVKTKPFLEGGLYEHLNPPSQAPASLAPPCPELSIPVLYLWYKKPVVRTWKLGGLEIQPRSIGSGTSASQVSSFVGIGFIISSGPQSGD